MSSLTIRIKKKTLATFIEFVFDKYLKIKNRRLQITFFEIYWQKSTNTFLQMSMIEIKY